MGPDEGNKEISIEQRLSKIETWIKYKYANSMFWFRITYSTMPIRNAKQGTWIVLGEEGAKDFVWLEILGQSWMYYSNPSLNKALADFMLANEIK